MGSGDLSPLLKGLYEEQEKYQDSMNTGELTISRRILVNMHRFLAKFMQPREALLWEMIMKVCQSDYERPQFVHTSWRLFWNSLRKVNVQKDWNEWNPYWRPEAPSPFKNKRFVLFVLGHMTGWNACIKFDKVRPHCQSSL